MAAIYPYRWIWLWRIERLGNKNVPPSINVKENVKNAIEANMYSKFESVGHEVVINSIKTERNKWELWLPSGLDAIWRLEGSTVVDFKTDLPHIEEKSPIGVAAVIALVIVGASAVLTAWLVLQMFQTRGSYLYYRQIQEEFPCPYCDEVFDYQSELTEHIKKAHTGEKAFVCPFKHCGAMFNTQEELTEHINKVHGGPPPDTFGDIALLILALVGLIVAVIILLKVIK